MKNPALPSAPRRLLDEQSDLPSGRTGLAIADLKQGMDDWLMDCRLRQHSDATLRNRRLYCDKLLWFLADQGAERCGTREMRSFLAYLTTGHESETGRWGTAKHPTACADQPRYTKRVKPSTVQTYYRHLSALWNFLVAEEQIADSPMSSLKQPIVREDQIQPFTGAQVKALLTAAGESTYSRRDIALVYLLLDTGARASEVCGLTLGDLDLKGRSLVVQGKGGKSRKLYLGMDCSKALWAYLRDAPRHSDDPRAPLFFSERGDGLTRGGLNQIIRRLGARAKIEACRCSPHIFRHTFAVEFLRAGGNVFSLQQMLGHSALKMTNRYVNLAAADIENQHRQYSPGDRLRRKQ